ncbi:hypothetical protein SGCZBJ_07455 [Caulobacter zeae]|uniref:Uncharacterized protein n=1 Tax=Caulobacter zeae TaxID=2055137 RepID=A0A2N5DN84_9CAUL|nr:hypothetical protein [Caulobacter zeae]PLR27523.1 hypothetical protein SGCZBJ_07455 [Caulobacter zeae]
MIDAKSLSGLVERELEAIADARVRDHVRSLLVEPRPILRDWDYGEPGQQYVCWTIVEDLARSRVAIAYCEQGFGPANPWGLVWTRDDGGGEGSIGMDSAWFFTLEEAVYESVASALPIWRFYGRDGALSEEMDWEAAWKACATLRAADPDGLYGVDRACKGPPAD